MWDPGLPAVPPSEPTPESRFAQTMKQLLSRLGALSVILVTPPFASATLLLCVLDTYMGGPSPPRNALSGFPARLRFRLVAR